MAWPADPPAATVAQALGGRRNGTGWLCRCPAHQDRTPSLSIADSSEGRLLVRCFAGCDPVTVLAAIGALDLGGAPLPAPDSVVDRRARDDRIARARAAWSASAPIGSYDIVDCYLIKRGLGGRGGPWPEALRTHPGIRHPAGDVVPALVAAATRWPDLEPRAVQITALDRHSASKADLTPPRWTLGHLAGAAVQLVPWQAGRDLVLVEGVEDGLAVREAVPDVGVWAALGAANVASVALPPAARIVLALDADAPGERAAAHAARAIADRGHPVRIAHLGAGLDPLDALLEERAA